MGRRSREQAARPGHERSHAVTTAFPYEQVLETVRSWPAAWRLSLAEALLGSLHQELGPSPPRGVPAEKVRGIAAGDGPPPDDDTLRRWVEEHRAEKYG